MVINSRKRRGLSEVMSTIILTGMVITIGVVTWGYASGSTTITAQDYIDGTMEQISYIEERFTIERIYYKDGELNIFIYNYGPVDVVIDTYLNYSNNSQQTDLGNSIAAKTGDLVKFTVNQNAGIVNIKCHSWRSNDAIAQYWID